MQNVLSDERIELLKEYGVKPYEISHLKNGTKKKIGKARMKIINRLLNARIVDAGSFVPFDDKYKKYFAGNMKMLVEPITFERY